MINGLERCEAPRKDRVLVVAEEHGALGRLKQAAHEAGMLAVVGSTLGLPGDVAQSRCVAVALAVTEGGDVAARLATLRSTASPPPVLAVSARWVPSPWLEGLVLAQAPGDASPDVLAEALRGLVPAGRQRLALREALARFRERRAKLSQAELLLMREVCSGRLNKQVAADQGVSLRTVEQRRKRLYDKMGVEHAAELIFQAGLISGLEGALPVGAKAT